MIDKYYNPLSVYKRKEVKQQLQNIFRKVKPKKKLGIKDTLIQQGFSMLFYEITKTFFPTNFLGEWYAKLVQISTNYNLRFFQNEQLIYLETHPEDLIREVRINLVVSILLLKQSFFVHDEMGRFSKASQMLWNMIKHWNVQEGLMETTMQRMERNISEMWLVLRHPIALLMNVYYVNNNVSMDKIEAILADLINAGKSQTNIDGLCRQPYPTILQRDVKWYLEHEFDSLREYAEKHKDSFPSLSNIIAQYGDYQKKFIEELNTQEKEEYEFYRNEIQDWAKQYPAMKDSVNGNFVIKAIQTIANVPSAKINVDSRLIEDLKLDKEKKQELCLLFEKEKSFVIDNIYLEKFMTVGEIISYWNAFDNHAPIDMMP